VVTIAPNQGVWQKVEKKKGKKENYLISITLNTIYYFVSFVYHLQGRYVEMI